MKKLFLLITTAVMVYIFHTIAYAEYMVKLSDEAIVPYSVSDNVVFAEGRVYKTSEAEAKQLLKNGYADYIEEIQPVVAYEAPSDPLYKNQKYMSMMNIGNLDNIAGTNGYVKIGIVDSGVYREHPDLVNANIETGYNYVENNTDTSDKYGHGTRVTGIIAATPDNSIGIAGIAPNAVIVPYVTITLDSTGTSIGGSDSLIKCIVAAANEGCDVINLSVGIENPSKLLKEAVDYAVAKGAILVAAAGNYGNTDNANIYCYPAAYDNVISVGAITGKYALASYSQKNDKINTVAVVDGLYSTNISGGYSFSSGTSFACPIVTGIIGRIVAKYPEITPEYMLAAVNAAAIDLDEPGRDYFGYGLLMADEIINYIESPHSVFISPVLYGDSFNIKLAAKSDIAGASLVTGLYSENGINSCSIEDISFEDGLFFKQVSVDTGKIFKMFVIDNVFNQKSLSVTKKYLQ